MMKSTKNYNSFFVFIFFFTYAISANAQNGWVKKKGELYAQAAVSNFSSNKYYSPSGTLLDEGSTFNSRGLLLYGEYGITDRLTAVFDAPIFMLNSFSTTETVGGIGSVKLGVKYGLLKNFPLTFAVDFEIPTDDGVNLSSAKEANELGIVDQINLPTSDGEFNIWTTLAASKSLADNKTFGSIYGRVNIRTQEFSPQWQSGFEIGHLFFEKLYLIGKLQVQGKLAEETSTGGSFLYGEGTTFTSVGLTSIFKINDKWSVIASYADYTDLIVDRKNIYGGGTYSLGVSVEY